MAASRNRDQGVSVLQSSNVAVVTGANRGIGRAFCQVLLASGVQRLYACARSTSSLQPLVESAPDVVVPLRLDLTKPQDIDAVVAACTEVDLVISNAGREGYGDVLTLPDDHVRDLFEVHVHGPLRLIRGLAVGMPGGSRIMLVHSTAAMSLSRGGPLYSASKAASMMLGLGLRESLAPMGLTVTNVYPGFTNTDIIADYDIAKADPVDVARAALDATYAGSTNAYPDLYAQLVHEAMRDTYDAAMDEPGRTGTEIIARYRALSE